MSTRLGQAAHAGFGASINARGGRRRATVVSALPVEALFRPISGLCLSIDFNRSRWYGDRIDRFSAFLHKTTKPLPVADARAGYPDEPREQTTATSFAIHMV
jgi:hypothetical protein